MFLFKSTISSRVIFSFKVIHIETFKMELSRCTAALTELADFLIEFSPLINVCMVDFITKNIFLTVLSQDVADELSQLTDEQIVGMPERCLNIETLDSSSASALDKLLHRLSRHRLENMQVTSSCEKLESKFKSCTDSAHTLQFFDRIASDKKMHEVVILSDVISRLVTSLEVGAVIDLGSGKGYLSHVFAATHTHLNVVAIEGSGENSEGAIKRKMKLEKRWDGLLRRALIRAQGVEPPARGKKWKSKSAKVAYNDEPEDCYKNDFGAQESFVSSNDKSLADNLRFVTQFVDEKTDLEKLFLQNFPARNDLEVSRFGIVGLHTCGSLATSSIKIFLAKEGAKFCCNVGCCYHLLPESGPDASFPVSSVLKNRNFRFGRNPLMLAAQPMDRSIANKELPDRSLLWRAALQVILLRHVPDLTTENQQVGRIAAKSGSFVDYVRKAIKKLNLSFELSNEEIVSTFESLSLAHRQRLNAFYQLRSLYAPLVEGLILLDRLVFLLEQKNVSEAHLVRLFDPVISPRCYALIAVKADV